MDRIQKIPTKVLLIAVFVLLTGVVLLLRIRQKPNPAAAWWNETWIYRQAIDIGWTGSDLTDFQVSFDIGTSALVNAGKMQTDCDDIRITDTNGKLLPHWIEENNPGCNVATDTKIWVKTPSIPSTGATIYIYYGNSTADNTENGDNVFEFFDDFKNSTLDTSKWTQINGTNLSISGGLLTISANSDPGKLIAITAPTADNYTLRTRFKVIAGTNTSERAGVSIKTNSITGAGYNYVLGYNFTAMTNISYLDDGISWNLRSGNWSKDTFYTFEIYHDGTNVKGRYDDGSWSSQAWNGRTGYPALNFGSYSSEGATTVWEYAMIRKMTSSDPTSTPQSEEVTPGPIAYWKFDEGVGSTAHDASGQSNHGTITSATWQTEDLCVSGKCLKFDGTDDRVDVTTNISSWGNFSTSGWFKLSPTSSVEEIIVVGNSSTGGDGIAVSTTTSGQIRITHHGVAYGNTGPEVDDNNWHFFVLTHAGTTSNLYLDGYDLKSTYTGSSNLSTKINIGAFYKSSAWQGDVNGFIDEVKIYPYARTASQIKSDYASGLAGMGGDSSVNIGGDSLGKTLSEGLVGYWKMDEGSWDGTPDEVIDSSGNGNDGVAIGATPPTTGAGKFGNGGSFDGEDDYVTTPSGTSIEQDNTAKNYTITLWFSADTVVGGARDNFPIGQDNGGYDFFIEHSRNSAGDLGIGIGEWKEIKPIGTIQTNTWYFITVVLNGDKVYYSLNGENLIDSGGSRTNYNASYRTSMTIGSISPDTNNLFDGSIDEVRIYNRALSASEVKTLYNWTPGPTLHWDFNEGTGTSTIYDRSGNSNNGTMNGPFTNSNWVPGKHGRALKFDGNGKYVEATGYSAPEKAYTYNFWFKPPTNWSAGSGRQDFLYWGTGARPHITFDRESDGKIGIYITINGTGYEDVKSTTTSWNNNQWHYVSFTFNGTNHKVYVNGILENTITHAGTHNSASNPDIASAAGNTIGTIDDFKIYNYARTQKQILEDMYGRSGTTKSTLPIAYWSFDEGYGTTANDSVGSNNGTFGTGTSAPSWTNSGKIGKALSFDGNDYAQISSDSNLPGGTTNRAITAWVKVNNFNNGRIFSYGTWSINNAYDLIAKTGDEFMIVGHTNNYVTAKSNFSTSVWYHIAAILENGNLIFYYNGIKDSTQATTINTTLAGAFRIGGGTTGRTDDLFDGLIDEVKIYNYALSEDEVKQDYNQGASAVMGQSTSDSGSTAPAGSSSQEYCVPGSTDTCNPPIAEWKFDEKTGTSAYDTSGNSNTGTFGTGDSAPSWTTGKIGSALSFDGNNDYVNTPYTAANNLSSGAIESWVYWTGNTNSVNQIIGKSQAGVSWYWGLTLNRYYPTQLMDNKVHFHAANSLKLSGNTIISTNAWHHIAITWNGTKIKLYVDGKLDNEITDNWTLENNQYTVDVGREPYSGGQLWFKGKIDHTKIYDHARTPAQIAWDYNRGAPVGHWKFDKGEGLTAFDSSGLGNTGILNNMDNTNWVTGKNNTALEFNGSNDYVSLSYAPQYNIKYAITLSAWIKRTTVFSQTTDLHLLSRDPAWFFYDSYNSGSIRGEVYIDSVRSAARTVPVPFDSNWYHILYTYDSNTQFGKIYKNGVLYSSIQLSGLGNYLIDETTSNFRSMGNNTYGRGMLIDDTRIYNYALTSTQVKALYNNSAISFQ